MPSTAQPPNLPPQKRRDVVALHGRIGPVVDFHADSTQVHRSMPKYLGPLTEAISLAFHSIAGPKIDF